MSTPSTPHDQSIQSFVTVVTPKEGNTQPLNSNGKPPGDSTPVKVDYLAKKEVPLAPEKETMPFDCAAITPVNLDGVFFSSTKNKKRKVTWGGSLRSKTT